MSGRLTPQSVRPDPVLSNIAALKMRQGNFLIDRLMPVVRVDLPRFKYAQYDTSDVTMDVSVDRALGVGASEVKFNQTWIEGTTKARSLKSKLPREIVDQATNPTAVENRRVGVVTSRLKIGMELSFRNLLVGLSSAGTPSVKWDASSGVTLKKNIDAYKLLFKAQAGILPNTFVCGYQVAQVVSNDPDVLARQKANDNNLITNGDLPPILFNMNTAVGGAVSQADSNSSLAEIWNTDDVWLAYVDQNVSEETFTFGAQFRSPTKGVDVASATWPDADVSANSDWYYSEVTQIESIICSSCIMRIDNVLSAI